MTIIGFILSDYLYEMRVYLLLPILLLSTSVVAQISITFQVNMSYQIQSGKFNPSSDYVDVAGTFNDWGGTQQQLSDDDNDDIWEITVSNFTANQNIEFKFRINSQWDGTEEFPGGGANRTHTVGTADETLSFWYNDEEPPTGPAKAGVYASNTAIFSGGTVEFQGDTEGLVETYSWTFEGGEPATSTQPSVNVTYSTPGTYDVKLVVSNSFSADSVLLEDYITVSEQSTDDLDWWNDAVFYEIFVRSFYDSDGDGIGDFQGIIEKLDYLNDGDPTTSDDLGITGIWLMPIHESPSYHGYDVLDYRSVNPDYGTMDDFKEFLSAAHDRGIKVIIDLVLNHTSIDIEWFEASASSPDNPYRNWYRWEDSNPGYSGPWGQTVWHNRGSSYYYGLFWGGMPDLNYEEPAVKEEVFDITRFWLEDIGIDGFRLDAVKYIYEDGNKLEDLSTTHQFWNEFTTVVKTSNPNAFSVGEAWTSTSKVVPYVMDDRLDFCFDFDLSSAMFNAINSRNVSSLRSQINHMISSYPYYQFGTFSTNHDQNRLMSELSSNESAVKLMAGMYLTLPGIPFLYYGEEIGMTGVKPDEDIRRPMSWSAESHAGFSTRSPWHDLASNYETYNVDDQQKDAASIFNWYRRLVHIRNNEVALRKGSFTDLDPNNSTILAFLRTYEEEKVVVLINASNSATTFDLSLDQFSNFDFEEPSLVDQLSGYVVAVSASDQTVEVALGARQTRILKVQNKPNSTSRFQNDFKVLPNPAYDFIKIESLDAEQLNYEILDQSGRKVGHGVVGSGNMINVSGLKPGLHLFRFESASGSVITKKILIER